MKKILLKYKTLIYAFALILLCANASQAQRVIINETFGTAVIASPYIGGTSTTPNQIAYTKTSSAGAPAIASVATTSGSGYLSLTSATTATTSIGRTYLTSPMPAGNFVSILKNNPYPISWTFNMRFNRSTNIDGLTSAAASNYVAAEVLVANSSDLLSATTKGYVVSIALGSVAGQQKIELSSFTEGLGLAGAAPLSIVSSPNFTASNYVSVKVTYTPSTDTWSLAVKDSGAGPFTDPSTDVYPTPQTAVNAVNTNVPMSHFGYFYYHNTGNAIFRTDNYKAVLESPFVTLPIVEPRQVFNSTINPTVANLVAVGTSGTLNWYSVLGGSVLLANTPIISGTYYVTQTIGGVESDFVRTSVFVGDTGLKSLPLYEGFANYNISDKLIIMNNSNADGIGLGSWSITPSSNISDDVTIVASPTWTNTVLPAATGNAISFVGSGIDPELKFTNTTSGSLYSSFVFNAVDAATTVASTTTDANYSTPTGFFSFMALSPSSVTPGTFNNDYASALMFRKNITSGKYNLGLSKSSDSNECVWSATEYDFNTQHIIVISYENIGDADALNQVAKLWIDPETSTQPAVTALTQNNPTTSVSRTNLDRIKILQASSSSTPTLIIDEIRVANNWGQALGGAATLGITSVKTSGLKIYPNPVSNGKFYIDSITHLEKDVTIYNTLGQQVQKSKASNEGIDVSYLSKGTYFVKITGEGISVTKKLVIQ
jgi:hypothetical protein